MISWCFSTCMLVRSACAYWVRSVPIPQKGIGFCNETELTFEKNDDTNDEPKEAPNAKRRITTWLFYSCEKRINSRPKLQNANTLICCCVVLIFYECSWMLLCVINCSWMLCVIWLKPMHTSTKQSYQNWTNLKYNKNEQ